MKSLSTALMLSSRASADCQMSRRNSGAESIHVVLLKRWQLKGTRPSKSQQKLYDSILHLRAWHQATACFKRTTAPKECPTSFKQFIESKMTLLICIFFVHQCMKYNYIGQDTLRRGMEQSVFKPVIPAGTELASMSVVVAPQERNVPLKVGNGTRTMLPVRNFSTKDD